MSAVAPRMIGAFAGIALAAIAGAQVYFNLVSVTYFAQGHGSAVLLGQMREALAETGRVRDAVNASQVWIVAPDDSSQVGSLGHVFDPLGELSLGAQTLGGARTLVWRPGPIPQVYLSARGSGPADRFLRQMASAVPQSTIQDLNGEPFMDVFVIKSQELEEAAQQAFIPVNQPSTVGVRLLGCVFDPDVSTGNDVSVALWWKVEDMSLLAPTSDERFFIHIASSPDGPQVAQEDGIGYTNWRWTVGDSVVSWFSIPIPPDTAPGDYLIRVGLYDLTSMERASFLNDRGQPETDSLLLGPVRIEGRS